MNINKNNQNKSANSTNNLQEIMLHNSFICKEKEQDSLVLVIWDFSSLNWSTEWYSYKNQNRQTFYLKWLYEYIKSIRISLNDQ